VFKEALHISCPAGHRIGQDDQGPTFPKLFGCPYVTRISLKEVGGSNAQRFRKGSQETLDLVGMLAFMLRERGKPPALLRRSSRQGLRLGGTPQATNASQNGRCTVGRDTRNGEGDCRPRLCAARNHRSAEAAV